MFLRFYKVNMKPFASGIITLIVSFLASQDFTLRNIFDQNAIVGIARFILYLLIMKGSEEAIQLIHKTIRTRKYDDIQKVALKYKKKLSLFAASIIVVYYFDGSILKADFLLFTIASLFTKYAEMKEQTSLISYGTGMACSFFEGYLINVIPPDGTLNSGGFLGKITTFESNNKIVFPVRRLFLIVTKGLHCPTDLKDFNREHTTPNLEACNSLEDVQKDVAGVKRRIYRNSAYKIHRSNGPPVYLAAECATPLHTLYKVKQHKSLYEELIQADYEEIRDDFCAMLQAILDNSPDCRGKCEIVHYDRPKRYSCGGVLACIYLEGYLVHVIPSSGDPYGFDGIRGSIKKFEANNKLVVPVWRLFIVVAKGLHCPTDLEEFNRDHRYPQLEACKSLEKVRKNHAGSKNRVYRNTVYKIRPAPVPQLQPDFSPHPVHLAAECISMFHSLYRVSQKTLYQDLLKGVDYDEIFRDFCWTLKTALDRDPDCRNKCELVYYNPEDESQNLAEILLNRIKAIQDGNNRR